MIIIPAMNIHFEQIYTSFGIKCYAMRSLHINKKTVTQRFTQFNHRPQNVNTNVLISKAIIPWA